MPPTTDPWRSCRFCLCANAGMRPLPHHDQLAHTEIAQLFEAVTGSPLDCSAGYSGLLCAGCEQRLRDAAQVRADFVSVAQRWLKIRLGGDGLLVVAKTELGADDDDSVDDDDADNEKASFSDFCDKIFVDVHEIKPEVQTSSADKHQEVDKKPPTEKSVVSLVHLPVYRKHHYPHWHRPAAGVRLTCDFCGAQLSSRPNLRQHLRNHLEDSEGKSYICTQCPKTYTNRSSLAQHELKHRQKATGERRPFVCELCGFVFAYNVGLQRHMLKHKDGELPAQQIVRVRVPPVDDTRAKIARPPVPADSRIVCPVCKKTYSNRSSLQTHIRISHGAEGLVEWKRYLATVCVVCNERCADARALREHRRVHQPYHCQICRQAFDARSTWETHTKMHAAIKRPHVCGVCQAQYPSPFALRQHHRRAHTDERPFECELCDRAYAEVTELRKHIEKSHTGKPRRTFACPECPADAPPFKSRMTLRKHMELHTGVARFQCKVCSMRQSTVTILLEHMRQFHPDDVKDANL